MPETEPRYTVTFGTDNKRDGVFLELSRLEPGESYPIVEFFRSDRDGRITISAEDEPIPADWFSHLIDQAKTDLLPRPLNASNGS